MADRAAVTVVDLPETDHHGETSINGSDLEDRIKRAKQTLGPQFDLEIGVQPELGRLQLSNIDCGKNPEHPTFIQTKNFKLEDLPEKYRIHKLFDYILSVASLTGLINVFNISESRPTKWKGKEPYPMHDNRGQDIPTCGTGTVFKVGNKFHTSADRKTCPCKKCKVSRQPELTWAAFYVRTAAHVIFDTIEARRCTFSIPKTGNGRGYHVTYGVDVVDMDVEGDWCQFKCITHDRCVYDKLKSDWERMRDLRVHPTLAKLCFDESDLAVIVSHPHGVEQHITIGKWTESVYTTRNIVWGRTQYHYITDTCRGSSGAPVILLGKKDVGAWFRDHHPHSLAEETHNSSSAWWEARLAWWCGNVYTSYLSAPMWWMCLVGLFPLVLLVLVFVVVFSEIGIDKSIVGMILSLIFTLFITTMTAAMVSRATKQKLHYVVLCMVVCMGGPLALLSYFFPTVTGIVLGCLGEVVGLPVFILHLRSGCLLLRYYVRGCHCCCCCRRFDGFESLQTIVVV